MDSFNVLNEYLMSRDVKYYVFDTDVANAKTVIFQPYPSAADLRVGKPVSALMTWQGVKLFDDASYSRAESIATLYISNVPLYSTDEYTVPLAPQLEALRLSPHVENDYLRERFAEKMRAVIESETVRLVSYKLEIFERLYRDFLARGDKTLVNKLECRISDGTLKILPFPTYRLDYLEKSMRVYKEFEAAFAEITK